ncbi:MAG: hypothetical protein HY238_12295 [Acidobacteria bacterium]|nr:hypothetical protein [Acidobacteriota bacterium]
MAELTLIIALAERLAGWLKSLLDADAETRARWKGAVQLLQEAVLNTQAYVVQLDRGTPVNRQVERGLADAWQRAAGAFYGLDRELAERLQLKGEYWIQPESWTDQQVLEANISLQHVAEYTRQLLREGR